MLILLGAAGGSLSSPPAVPAVDAFGAAPIPGALLLRTFLLISCKPSTDGSEPETPAGNGGDTPAEVTVDLSAAKVGYNNVIDFADGVLTISMSPDKDGDYTQTAIPMEVGTAKKAVVTFANTDSTTIGFMEAGSNPWGGRITGSDTYYDASESRDIELDIPEGAGFITFGSNGKPTTVITISKIVLK